MKRSRILAGSDLSGRAVALLRRASVAVAEADARRYFIPRGTRLQIDLNVVGSYLLRVLAAGIESRRVKLRRKSR